MGWSHPDISIEYLVDQIKGFVDILILASGYQSSGLPATWDVDNIKKAVKWGIFFEDVLKSLRFYGNYEESMKELDEALSHLTSDSCFPLGLANMSSATLCNARRLILEHFMHTDPIKNENLVAFLRAVVEMDIDQLSEYHYDSSKTYIDRLTLQMKSLDVTPAGRGLAKGAKTSLPEYDPIAFNYLKHIDQNYYTALWSNGENRDSLCVDNSFFVAKEILNRQAVMSYMSSIEKGLTGLSDIIIQNNLTGSNGTIKSGDVSSEDQMLELYQFNHWRSKCLSYFLDKRTIKLLSGVQLVLKAPKEQWVRVFEGLRTSRDHCSENLIEILEILLLGLISSTWTFLIQQLISLPCDFLLISEKFSELHDLVRENSPLHSNKEKEIIEYLTKLLSSQSDKIWKLPSVLVAAAIPSWSTLFRTHLMEVENHYNESYPSTRCRWCCQHGNVLQECQVTDRIQSLHALHIRCSPGRY